MDDYALFVLAAAMGRNVALSEDAAGGYSLAWADAGLFGPPPFDANSVSLLGWDFQDSEKLSALVDWASLAGASTSGDATWLPSDSGFGLVSRPFDLAAGWDAFEWLFSVSGTSLDRLTGASSDGGINLSARFFFEDGLLYFRAAYGTVRVFAVSAAGGPTSGGDGSGLAVYGLRVDTWPNLPTDITISYVGSTGRIYTNTPGVDTTRIYRSTASASPRSGYPAGSGGFSLAHVFVTDSYLGAVDAPNYWAYLPGDASTRAIWLAPGVAVQYVEAGTVTEPVLGGFPGAPFAWFSDFPNELRNVDGQIVTASSVRTIDGEIVTPGLSWDTRPRGWASYAEWLAWARAGIMADDGRVWAAVDDGSGGYVVQEFATFDDARAGASSVSDDADYLGGLIQGGRGAILGVFPFNNIKNISDDLGNAALLSTITHNAMGGRDYTLGIPLVYEGVLDTSLEVPMAPMYDLIQAIAPWAVWGLDAALIVAIIRMVRKGGTLV